MPNAVNLLSNASPISNPAYIQNRFSLLNMALYNAHTDSVQKSAKTTSGQFCNDSDVTSIDVQNNIHARYLRLPRSNLDDNAKKAICASNVMTNAANFTANTLCPNT